MDTMEELSSAGVSFVPTIARSMMLRTFLFGCSLTGLVCSAGEDNGSLPTTAAIDGLVDPKLARPDNQTYHTFCIPAVAATRGENLVVLFEGRKRDSSDFA